MFIKDEEEAIGDGLEEVGDGFGEVGDNFEEVGDDFGEVISQSLALDSNRVTLTRLTNAPETREVVKQDEQRVSKRNHSANDIGGLLQDESSPSMGESVIWRFFRQGGHSTLMREFFPLVYTLTIGARLSKLQLLMKRHSNSYIVSHPIVRDILSCFVLGVPLPCLGSS